MITFRSAVLAVRAALVGTALPATAIDDVAADRPATANPIDVATRAPAAILFNEDRIVSSLALLQDADDARAQAADKKSWRATIFGKPTTRRGG
jgi:hypothetical protein